MIKESNEHQNTELDRDGKFIYEENVNSSLSLGAGIKFHPLELIIN